MEKDLQVGDLVVLRSKGPEMTIISIDYNRAECGYFRDGVYYTVNVSTKSLKKSDN